MIPGLDSPAIRAQMDAYLKETRRGVYPEPFMDEACHIILDGHNAREFLDTATGQGWLRPGARVLDVGCGLGTFVQVALRSGFDAHGVELDARDAEMARRRLEAAGLPAGRVVSGDGASLPFESGRFDLVTFFDVLEHVPHVGGVLDEAVRMLAPGGRLLIISPNYLARFIEPHYRVPWLPLLPKAAALPYLRWLGRRQEYFRDCVFNRTLRQVVRALHARGFQADSLQELKLEHPERIGGRVSRALIRGLKALHLLRAARLAIRSPFNPTIALLARRAGEGT